MCTKSSCCIYTEADQSLPPLCTLAKLTKDERIKEKKVKRREKDLAQKAQEEEQNRPRTAEEEAAEKLRLLKLQKESDLETAKQLFGGLWDTLYHGSCNAYSCMLQAIKLSMDQLATGQIDGPFLVSLYTYIDIGRHHYVRWFYFHVLQCQRVQAILLILLMSFMNL